MILKPCNTEWLSASREGVYIAYLNAEMQFSSPNEKLRDHAIALLKANPMPEPMSERDKITKIIYNSTEISRFGAEMIAYKIIAMRDEK